MLSQNITISASEARSKLYNLIDTTANEFKRYIITKKGKAKAALISLEELESWEETISILSDKKLTKDIKQGLKDLEQGNLVSEKNLF